MDHNSVLVLKMGGVIYYWAVSWHLIVATTPLRTFIRVQTLDFALTWGPKLSIRLTESKNAKFYT